MDFDFTPEQEAWRQEIRDFIKANPAEKFPMESGDEGYGYGGWSNEYGRLLGSKGWISLAWPKEHGGQGRPPMDLLIMMEELAYAEVPWYSVSQSFTSGSMVIDIGTEELQKELLPGTASGDTQYWLAMSEPGAGSDLLSLQTKAVEMDDHYLVNGQKIWSTMADRARYGLLFARTEFGSDASRAKTISMFLLDNQLPGVTVRPLYNLWGEVCHNEVFMDDVKVPKRFLLGKKNLAFPHMLSTLDYDRFWARFIKPPFCKSTIEQLVGYVKETKRDGVLLSEDRMIRHQLAESAIEVEACRLIFWNAGWKMCNGIPFSMEAAIGKIMADEMGQRLYNKGMQIMGLHSRIGRDAKWAPLEAKIQRAYLFALGHPLAGGTSEIIRNTIATVGLGLPRG